MIGGGLRALTGLGYGDRISWRSWPRRRTGLSNRMCRCGWVISDINRPAIAPSAQANHDAGSGRIHGTQHGPGSSCKDERLAGAGSRRVQGRWIGIALSQEALSAYAAAGIGDLIEDASSGGLLAVIAIDISIGLPDAGRRQLRGSHRRPRADCPVLGVIPLGMRRLSGHPGGLARASRAFRFCFNRAFRPWFRCLALAKVSHRQLAGMGIAGSCCRSRLPFRAWTG